MNKQIFFLSGMFRCGTNLLRSIMNQNPNFYVSPNSFLPEVFQLLHRTKETDQYKDWEKLDIDINYYNNEKYYNDIIKNTFNNYYSSYKQKYIMDQARWGAPGNFRLLMYYDFLPKKFVMLVRPFEDILTELYDFLNIPLYKHKFKNFSQVDIIGNKPSIIRTNKVEKINYKDNISIPKQVKQKYKKQIMLLNEYSK